MANNQKTTDPKTATDGASANDEQGRYVVPRNRRDFLRTVGAAGAAGIGTFGAAGVASADDSTSYDSSYVDPVMAKSGRKKADYSACSNYGGRRVSNSTSLIYWGSDHLSNGDWVHMFTASTHGRCEDRQCTENNWHPANTLERIKYTWETAYTDGSSQVLDPLLNDVGGDPPPNTGDDPDYDDPVYTVLSELASVANDSYNYALSASNIVTALVNDQPDDSGPEVIYDWYYGGSTDKANVSYVFEVQSNHKYIDFDFEALVREDHYNPHATTSWSIERTADENN